MIYSIIIAALVAAALAVFIIALCRNGISERARQVLLGLVTIAERQFGSGGGEIKLSAVAGWLYSVMPALLQLLFSADTVEKWINEAVEKMKEKLGS